MYVRDVFALVIAALLVYIVMKSMFRQWGGEKQTPLRGKFRAAMDWLEENGYQVLRVRERAIWTGYYDSRQFERQLIADFIVRKGAKTYVVKLTSTRDKGVNGLKLRGDWQPLVTAFNVNGALQVDVENEQVHSIDFTLKSPSYVLWRRVLNRSLWFCAGVLAAVVWLHGR
jgi:hypothetical protein